MRKEREPQKYTFTETVSDKYTNAEKSIIKRQLITALRDIKYRIDKEQAEAAGQAVTR